MCVCVSDNGGNGGDDILKLGLIERERGREKEIYRPIYTNTCKHGNRGRMPFNKFFAVSRV